MHYRTEDIKPSHHREDFDCGKEPLDNYLKHQVNQDVRRKLAVCFVLTQTEDKREKVKGYYTLSSASISRELIPDRFQKKFPKSYASIPTTLIGRLARDKRFKGKRVGEFLLLDALFKCHESAKTVASFAVIVDPIDAEARTFYEKYGFDHLPDSERMFLPMKTVNQLFED